MLKANNFMAIRILNNAIAQNTATTFSTKAVMRAQKNFFARYQTECNNFVTHIKGITDTTHLNKYAMVILTRLMFLYFLQHKNFLDNDPNYLSNHLKICQNCKNDSVSNFYRDFLQILFKELSDPTQSAELSIIVGKVPLLDIDLFKKNQIESHYASTHISNDAFESLFAYFNAYIWTLSDQTYHIKHEITPEIFSYIFEKSINQKQSGAYYTQKDITEYIAKSTIIPLLFNSAEKKYSDAFRGKSPMWQILRNDIDRYIYPAIKKGVEVPLPVEIEEGLNDVSSRNNWNSPASDTYALPSETWREVIARRQQYQELHIKLEADASCSIDELVTYNLDIRQFAQDVLDRCEDLDLIQAFYESMLHLSVLDPTCGSGAFLFAALDILEPLYTACLKRLNELESISRSNSACDRQIEYQISNFGYTIIKSLITSNLYGVDMMEEAIEICKLRFWLKLLAQRERLDEIEPLPDLAGHFRTGNTLFSSTDDHEWNSKDCSGQHTFNHSGLESKSFHWFVEYSTIMQTGGFDVIIGNPPYIESKKISNIKQLSNYTTLATGNMYAFIMERCSDLLAAGGRFGMIVPVSATCTEGYIPLQHILLEQSSIYISSFSDQRGKLFEIPHPRLCIISYQKQSGLNKVFSTTYIKHEWKHREHLFQRLKFIEITKQVTTGSIPRYGTSIEQSVHAKLFSQSQHLGQYLCKNGTYKLYFTRKLSWFVQVTPFIPRIIDAQDRIRNPSELKTLCFTTPELADIAFVALNSNLFYWILTTRSDGRNLNMREVLRLPLNIEDMSPKIRNDLRSLAGQLADELQVNSEMRRMNFKESGPLTIQCILPCRSKTLIDQIDCILAHHYGFSDEELDFITNYDIKYRVGRT